MANYYNTISTGRTQQVHCKWVNYFDPVSSWHPIDVRFRNDGSAFVSDYAPFRYHIPAFAHQPATLEVNNEYDIFGRQRITAPAMVFEATPENIRPVAGRIDEDNPSQIWYDDAWAPGISLRYTVWHGRAPRVTREAVIDPQRLDASFRNRELKASWLVRCRNALTLINGRRPIRIDDGKDWTGTAGDSAVIPETGAAVHAFDGHSVDPVRGSGFKAPRIWYWKDIDPHKGRGTLVSESAKVTATVVDRETIRLTKTVRADLVDAAAAEGSLLITDDVQTIYPDPDPEVTTVDGNCMAWGAGYSPKSGNGAVVSDTAVSVLIGSDHLGGVAFSRGYTLFDLTALDGETLTEATYSGSISTGGVTAYPAIYRITEATTASNTALTVTDFENTYNNHDTTYGTLSDADDAGHNRRSGVLNATGLAYVQSVTGGICKLSLRGEADSVAGTGSDPSNSSMQSAETSGTDDDPYLELTIAEAAAGGGTDPHKPTSAMHRCRLIPRMES